MNPLESHLNGLVQTYHVPMHDDDRGRLVAFDLAILPFAPIRVFTVRGHEAAVRGGHGHIAGRQLLVAVHGAIEIEARASAASIRLRLDDQANAVLIASPVWAQQTYLDEGATLLVFCDTPYNPSSYVTKPSGS